MPQKSVSRKPEETQGLTARNWLVFGFDPEIHPFGPPTFESAGKKLETHLDLTLWIIESLVGNP
jgi:hypothetical protein